MTLEWVEAEACFWLEISRDSLLVLSVTTNIWGGVQSNVVNLHFVSEVRPEVVRDISISRDQLELFLSEEERNITFSRPSVRSYLSFRSWRSRRTVKDSWFVGLIFVNLGEQQVNVLLQNSEQSACDDQLFWAYRKLTETSCAIYFMTEIIAAAGSCT